MLAAPMARLQKKMQAAVTTGKAGTTGIPCAMVYGLSRALPGVRALIATVVGKSRRVGARRADIASLRT